jgi:hypothetical protein
MAHRLHVPPWYTAAAPHNDIPLPSRVRDIVTQSVLLPWLNVAPEVTIEDHSAPVLYDEAPVYGAGVDVCLYGWWELWSATQSVHVSIDLTGVPTSVAGEPVDGIGLLMPGVGFKIDHAARGSERYPEWTITAAVDGDVVGSTDWVDSPFGVDHASPPPYFGLAGWPYREMLPVPPVYFGAPAYPPVEWSIWWGAALGDDLPSEVTWDMDVTFFEAHRHFRVNAAAGGTCATEAAAFAAAQVDTTGEGVLFAEVPGFDTIPGAGVLGYTLAPSDERPLVMVV